MEFVRMPKKFQTFYLDLMVIANNGVTAATHQGGVNSATDFYLNL